MSEDRVDKNLNEVFEMEPVIINDVEIIEPPKPKRVGDRSADKDFNEVRRSLKDIIDRGTEAIDGILQVASETESPRAYEVAAQMIKTVADANKDLLEIHKKIKDIKKENTTVNNTTNNSLFLGSTKDLQMFLKEQKENMMLEEKDAENG